MSLGYWDLVLLLVVTTQATAIAYVPQPRVKALFITFPFPFSLAYLALGQPVDASNLAGLLVLLLFTHAVRWLYIGAKVPIVAAIVVSALLYGVVGGGLARVVPRTEPAFWLAAGVVLAVGLALLHWQPHRDEPAHRSPLPLYIKIPVVLLVVAGLILVKTWLRGFMTVFPMVGVVAAYEARHSLWTMTRQIQVVMLTIGPMIVAMHLARPTGRWGCLVVGWVVFAITLTAVGWVRRRLDRRSRRELAT